MKRYACNHLYDSKGDYYSNQIVEIDENGNVFRFYQLKEEMRNTIWLGGTIVLSNNIAWHLHNNDINASFIDLPKIANQLK